VEGQRQLERRQMISFIFSAIWQFILGRFGMSDAQKLGRAQVENNELRSDLDAKSEEARVMEAPGRPESVVDNELRRHAK